MRLLVVSNGYPPRGRFGTEFYTGELVRGLVERGHEVFVLHPERSGRAPRYTLEEVDEGGVRVFLLHNPGDPRRRFRPSYEDARVEGLFRELLERLRPDRVHFLYLVWGLSVGLPRVARELSVPAGLTLTDYTLLCHRGQMYDHRLRVCGGPHPPAVCARCIREPGRYDGAPWQRLARRWAAHGLAALGGAAGVPTSDELRRRVTAVREALESVAFVVAPTRHLGRVFQGQGLAPGKVRELCYAFDETPFEAVRGSSAPKPPRLGFLGQLAPHKGVETLLHAIRILEREGEADSFELVLHGTFPARRHRLFRERVLELSASPRVRLGPPFEPEEAPSVLAGFTALVVPSEWDENAPLAVLQARSAGVPIVGSAVPGIAEVVRPGRDGILVAPGDPRAWAGALRRVLRGDPARSLDPGLPVSYDEHLTRLERWLEEAG